MAKQSDYLRIEKEKKMISQCEECQYYAYDEDYEAYMCEMNMDEDEYARLVSGHRTSCPYYKRGDEYYIVRKQM